MTISSNTNIQKKTANSIVGVITDFNNLVLNKVHNYVNYTSSNYPTFSGSATYGQSGSSSTTGWSNPTAIPSGQLSENFPSKLELDESVVVASELLNNMLAFTRELVNIRKFTSTWYHKTGSTNNQVSSITGCASFNTSYPSVPTGTLSNYSKGETWTRSGATSITLNPTISYAKGNKAQAYEVNTAINNCFNEWLSKCYNSNVLTYTFYTCHQNCHSSCHSNRGRR